MPRYDFECPDGHRQEQTFSFADVPEVVYCGEIVQSRVDDEHGWQDVVCGKDAARQLSTGTWFINNKVMAPPSVRKAHSNISDL